MTRFYLVGAKKISHIQRRHKIGALFGSSNYLEQTKLMVYDSDTNIGATFKPGVPKSPYPCVPFGRRHLQKLMLWLNLYVTTACVVVLDGLFSLPTHPNKLTTANSSFKGPTARAPSENYNISLLARL